MRHAGGREPLLSHAADAAQGRAWAWEAASDFAVVGRIVHVVEIGRASIWLGIELLELFGNTPGIGIIEWCTAIGA